MTKRDPTLDFCQLKCNADIEKRQQEAINRLQDPPDWGLGAWGFRGLGFRGLGFRGLGFRV